METLYICIDESGTLSQVSDTFLFAGYGLTSREKYSGKSRKVAKIIANSTIEVKGTNISESERNQILHIMGNQHPFGIVINNSQVPEIVFAYKDGVAYYKDELLVVIVTKVLKTFDLTRFNRIEIIIDEQNLAVSVRNNLYNKLYRRICLGYFNAETYISPLALHQLKLVIKYVDSREYPLVQSADILANTIYKADARSEDYQHLLKIFKSL